MRDRRFQGMMEAYPENKGPKKQTYFMGACTSAGGTTELTHEA